MTDVSIDLDPLMSNNSTPLRSYINEGRRPSLIDAVDGRHVDTVKGIISHGDPSSFNDIIRKHQLLHVVLDRRKNAAMLLKIILDVVDEETLFARNAKGKTALHCAVYQSHFRCCVEIIKKNSLSLAQKDTYGNTPLHDMVRTRMNDACIEAIKHVTPDIINMTNNESLTTVHMAARERNPEILELLLQNGGDSCVKSKFSYTPLHFAAQSGSTLCVTLLLDAFRRTKLPGHVISYLNTSTSNGHTALMFAAREDILPICQALSASDVDRANDKGYTALHLAAFKGNLDIVKYLIKDLNANYSKLNDNGESPLFCSIFNKTDDCFSYLMKKCRPDVLSQGAILHLVKAASERSLKCLKIMCMQEEFRECIKSYRDKNQNSLLHIAIAQKSYKTAKKLIEIGANQMVTNKNNESPLHVMAAQSRYQELNEAIRTFVCDELLNTSNELIDWPNNKGETPLHLATRSGNIEMLRAMIRKDPNVLQQDKNGMTAVHIAAERGNDLCLRIILRHFQPANVKGLNRIKPHPLHLAARNGHMKCAQIMLREPENLKGHEKNLLLKDHNDLYPVDRTLKGKHHELFRFLLSQMKYNPVDEEFARRIHRYFKKNIQTKEEAILNAIIESDWSCVIFDGRYCANLQLPLENCKEDEDIHDKVSPCDSFALLVRKFPDVACLALDRHIYVQPKVTDSAGKATEIHNYTPFEYLQYSIDTSEKTVESPFTGEDIDAAKSFRLHPDAVEFRSKAWGRDHPLQEAVTGGHAQVLRHKLTQSWLLNKYHSYARWILYLYVVVDVCSVVIISILQSLLWNTHQLQHRFNGVTRAEVLIVYRNIYNDPHNSTLTTLLADIHNISLSDSQCTTFVDQDHGHLSDDAEVKGMELWIWSRAACAIFHLNNMSLIVMIFQILAILLTFLHFFLEIKFFRRLSGAHFDSHGISRLLRLVFMPFLLISLTSVDFYLGCRQELLWQASVMTVLFAWLNLVCTVNKVPRFSSFMPVSPKLFGSYLVMIFPLILFLIAFALSFHFLLMNNAAFSTVPYSLIKTLTLMLGDLAYDDIFLQDEVPVLYQYQANALFLVFITCIGGLVFNFIIRDPTDQLLDLRKRDVLNRATAHLNIHLLIDECAPRLRRRYTRSQIRHSNEKFVSFYVSSEMLSANPKEEKNEEIDNLVLEVAEIKNDLKTILERLEEIKR